MGVDGKTRTMGEEKVMRTSRFEVVESDNAYWMVVRDVQTGVLYAVSTGYYNKGNFTVLVDEDGKPLRAEIDRESAVE